MEFFSATTLCRTFFRWQPIGTARREARQRLKQVGDICDKPWVWNRNESFGDVRPRSRTEIS